MWTLRKMQALSHQIALCEEASFIPDELSELAGLIQEVAQRVKHDQHNGA